MPLKCGEGGYWCHGTCARHGECMYLTPKARCDVSICILAPGHDGAHEWPAWFTRGAHLRRPTLRVIK